VKSIWFVATAVAFLLIVGCQSSVPQATAPTVSAAKRGGTFVIAQAADPKPNPGNADGSKGSVISGVVYQGLVYIDKTGVAKPQLAESWDISPDQKVFTFKLRKGVKWQDGQDFTAKDAVFTYKSITPTFSATASGVFKDYLESAEAPDPYTLILTLKNPYGPFMNQLNTPIVPEHLYAGTDAANNPHNLKPIGTGPFILTSWVQGDSITFQRNDNYWKAEKPYFDKLVIKIIPEGASRIAALLAGEVDYLPYTEVEPQDFARIQDDPKIQWGTGLAAQAVVTVTLNTQRQPMGNKQFRQALMMALDRATLTRQTSLGLDTPSSSALHHSVSWALNPSVDLMKQYPFDPAKANQLLDEAGFPRAADGNRVKPLGFMIENGRPNFEPISQFVAQQWKAIGVPVNLMPVDRQLMIDTVYVKRDFDINLNELSSTGDPEPGISRLYTCGKIQPVGFTNGTGYCNADVDKLFDQGAAQIETSKRAPFYADVLKILADDVPALPLIDRQDHSVANAKFELKSTMWKEGLIYDQLSSVYQK
jgi:peptide/nickel transport system substrate-binding protein